MFKNKKIDSKQNWNGKDLNFDPDSSPEAWEHYRKYYSFSNYDFNNLFFYNSWKEVGLNQGYKYKSKWLNYINQPKNQDNRLYALENNTIIKENYCEASARLGGETDFNFNDKKVNLFQKIIGNDSDALKQLKICKDNYHTLVNFSLMQSMGNMQAYKGKNRFDRFDVFIHDLAMYFRGLSNNVLSASSDINRRYLISFLNQYINIYDYMKSTYFIQDAFFVDKIIEQGAMSIENVEDVVRYMNLAQEFWNQKESHFLKKEFCIVGDYFKNGGETYTINELLVKIESDLDCNENKGKYLIERCVERGYIIDCNNGFYTR